jgi:membrane fusion protein, macrolide-specific efflux system
MIKNKKRWIFISIILFVIIIIIFISVFNKKKDVASAVTKEIFPHRGMIATFVSTTGTVEPRNRLEIKPSIEGRIESILVREGEHVKAGQTLLWMSSSERAALIDAARAQGGSELKYWENIYKPIPLIAPISGTVIVRALEPGQTATTSTAVLVLSDMLLVKAKVDETDIGRVIDGQSAEISLDAYPDVKVNGRVILIKYESTIVNNVTTYEVQILPDKIPNIYKSGMSANINIYDKIKKNVLLLPNDAISYENQNPFVLVRDGKDQNQIKKAIKTGLTDDQNIEIISGLTEKDMVLVIQRKFTTSEKQNNGSPFMPQRKKEK